MNHHLDNNKIIECVQWNERAHDLQYPVFTDIICINMKRNYILQLISNKQFSVSRACGIQV
jgi:hypothetical protein